MAHMSNPLKSFEPSTSVAKSARRLALACLLLAASAGAWAQNKVVFQVSDNDPAKWNLALNNVRNLQQDVGADKLDVELVAYGPGIHMLKMDSPVANRVAEALGRKVKIVACENTMAALKLQKADMLPDLGYVPAGVTELMQRQQQGWAYIRP